MELIEHTIKGDKDVPCLRIGLRYVRGLPPKETNVP